MGREIVTRNDVARWQEDLQEVAKLRRQRGAVAGEPETPPVLSEDKYKDKLLKYIPADLIAIYLTLQGFVGMLHDPAPIQTIRWVIFGLILAISIPWQRSVAKIGKWSQLFIGAGAFAVWAISVGDPFSAQNIPWYQPAYGAMLLALYTFLIPLVEIK
jgi:hypothetical protein